VAGGQYTDGSNHSQAFVTVYNGSTWADLKVAGSLNVKNQGSVNSVGCTSSTSCVAVGQYTDGSNHYQAFVSVYNGSTWVDHKVAGALNVGNSADLNTVSCTSSTSCVAGGGYTDGSHHYQAFVSVYNGSTWVDHKVAGALNVGNYAVVSSVSCASRTSCVVGGVYRNNSKNTQAFVSVYNGSTWADLKVAGSLNVGGGAYVNSVRCTSSTSCVAGGGYKDGSNHTQAFVSVYNGRTWADHKVAGALNVGNEGFVNSVSCASSTSCVAGGVYTDRNHLSRAFVSVYNGSTWTDQEAATLLNVGKVGEVNSVSCTSSGRCVAGGQYADASSNFQAFLSSATLPVAHA
jgi:hypothetical protein